MNLGASIARGVAARKIRDSIAGEIAATLESIQRSRAGRLDDRDLAWLALVPVWTVPLARAAGFPEDRSLEEFLANAEAHGVVAQAKPEQFVSRRVEAALHRNLDHQFWMPDAERPRVLAELRERMGVQALWSEIRTILRRMPETDSPPALVQWRELANRAMGADVGQAATYLRDVLRQHLERGETAAALSWLRTGTLLGQALGGEIDSAVMRGRREIEVAYRRSHDRRALVGFLRREEQIRSFAELIEGPDEFWALHFLGVGGAGKTMLIRHISAELAEKHRCITARVDFDYISPHYPRLRPEQLLVELADELRVHSAPEEFARFEDRVRSLQEGRREQSAEGPAAGPLDSPEFQAVQRAFDDWLRGLNRRVVLILDTCEELAKFQPGGEMAPSIRATYHILEHLHTVLPSLRVVFAGRRPLAQAGAGWTLRRDGLAGGRRHLPEVKPYLRLHLLRGFDEQEVDAYFRHQQVSPNQELLEVIREKSRESTALIELLGECPLRTELLAGEPVPRPRSNPFDLSLYAQWLREMPDLSSTFVREGGTDPYIELRIARRLTEGVRNLLPAVTFLRRFDESMLRPAGGGATDTAFAANFRELAEQEWITYQNEEGGVFLEVDRNLHPRLVRYFDHNVEQRRLLEDARQKLARGLASLVRYELAGLLPQADVPGRETVLGFDLIYAALRALDPEPATDLWEEIEARIIATARWDWARTITARLLGEEEAGRGFAGVRPALLATQASVMLHSERGASVVQAWENVIAVAATAQPAQRAHRIENRAWLGKLAASQPDAITADDVVRLNQLWEQLNDAYGAGAYTSEQTAASLFAATETVVDAIEAGKRFGQLSVRNPASFAAESIGSELLAFGLTLCSRLHRDQARARDARAAALDALNVALKCRDGTTQVWAGWVAPDSLPNFAALEWLLLWRWFDEVEGAREAARLWTVLPEPPMPANEQEASPPQVSPDVERRLSLQLELLLGSPSGEFPILLPPNLEWLDSAYRGPPRFERAAHRAVAPLVVTLSHWLLANGEVERALGLLDMRIQEVKSRDADPEHLLRCQRAKLRITGRMRLHRRGEGLMARSLDTPELAAAAWPVRVLNGLPSPEIPAGEERVPRELVHAWWRSRAGSDETARRTIVRAAREMFPREKDDGRVPEAMLLADFAECDWYELDGVPAKWGGDLPTMLEEAIAKLLARPTVPVAERVRVTLRASALRQDNLLPERQQIGAYRLAELALEEGELLALRAPKPALRLLELAHERFVAAQHWDGALVSSICAATAARRAGLKAMVTHLVTTEIRPAYEKVAARLGDDALPDWHELERLAAGPADGLSRLDHPVWAGWLHRLFCCLLDEDRTRTKRKQLLWVARHYGENLPIELGLSDNDKRAVRSQLHAHQREDRLFRLGIASVLIFILGTGALAVWSQTAAIGFLGFGTVLFLAVVVVGLVKAVRSLHVSGHPCVINIEPVHRMTRADVASAQACRCHLQTQERAHPESPGFPWLTPGLQRYAPAARDTPFEVVDELAGRRRRLLGNAWWNRLAVPIVTPPLLAAPPWEGMTLLALPGAQNPTPSRLIRLRRHGTRRFIVPGLALLFIALVVTTFFAPAETRANWFSSSVVILSLLILLLARRCRGEELHFYRAGARRRTDAQRHEAWRTRRVESDSSRTWQLLVGRALEVFVRHGLHVNLSRRSTRQAPAAVYHVVGRAVSSSAGFHMNVASEDLLASQTPAAAESGRTLLGCEEIRGFDAVITILQGEPLTGHAVRSASDRESAALLRAMGGELFAAGAEIVVVLPSLPGPLAQAALHTLSRQLARARLPQLQHLLDAVVEVRVLIRDWPAPAEYGGPADREWYCHDQLEAALDVCLFARTNLPSPAPSSPPA